jgi:hypothetical protein
MDVLEVDAELPRHGVQRGDDVLVMLLDESPAFVC